MPATRFGQIETSISPGQASVAVTSPNENKLVHIPTGLERSSASTPRVSAYPATGPPTSPAREAPATRAHLPAMVGTGHQQLSMQLSVAPLRKSTLQDVRPNSATAPLHCVEDDLRLLRSLPAESVDLVYLDPPFFSSWISGGSWGYQTELDSSRDRWQGVGSYMDWVAAALRDVHRVLKPTGALFLICDETVGLYIRVLLDELIGPRDIQHRIRWTKVVSQSERHHIFYYHRSAEIIGHGHLYTVVRRQNAPEWSLVAFSFIQGRRAARPPAEPLPHGMKTSSHTNLIQGHHPSPALRSQRPLAKGSLTAGRSSP